MAFLLFDQAAADETGLLKQHADEYENSEARGVIVKGDTLEDVAKAQGVDAAELQKTVEKWNQYCADGKDPDFGYSAEMNVIGDGPYYLMACKPAVHYTMGGLHITPEAEVLTVEGTPIAGLYAAGEVAGHQDGHEPSGLLLYDRHLHLRPHRRARTPPTTPPKELTVRSVHDSATAAPAFRDRGATVAFLHRRCV